MRLDPPSDVLTPSSAAIRRYTGAPKRAPPQVQHEPSSRLTAAMPYASDANPFGLWPLPSVAIPLLSSCRFPFSHSGSEERTLLTLEPLF